MAKSTKTKKDLNQIAAAAVDCATQSKSKRSKSASISVKRIGGLRGGQKQRASKIG